MPQTPNQTEPNKFISISNIFVGIATLIIGGAVGYFTYWYTVGSDIDKSLNVSLDKIFESAPDKQLDPAATIKEFENLKLQIEKKTNDPKEIEKFRKGVAEKLSAKFQVGTFNLSNYRNLQLELTSIEKWPEFSSYLEHNPVDNLNILKNFERAFISICKREPQLCKKTVFSDNGGTRSSYEPKDKVDGDIFRDLSYGYRYHIVYLQNSLEAVNDKDNREFLRYSLCRYYLLTENMKATRWIFGIEEDSEWSSEIKQCNSL